MFGNEPENEFRKRLSVSREGAKNDDRRWDSLLVRLSLISATAYYCRISRHQGSIRVGGVNDKTFFLVEMRLGPN